MKVLLTGGTGLVGIHTLVEMLNHGKSVRALVRSEAKLKQCLTPFSVNTEQLEIVEGDITDSSHLSDYVNGCDALVHAAGIFSNDQADREKVRAGNIEGTRNFISEAHGQGLDPIIYISSYLALFPPAGTVMSEKEAVKSPKEMYASSKAESEKYIRALQEQHQAPIVSIYPGSIHGPHDPTYGIGTKLLEQGVKAGRMLVTEGGRGFTDVRDLAQLINKALEAGKGSRRYMFGGYYITHKELLGILEQTTGREVKPFYIPGAVLRLIGSVLDAIARLSGKSFVLTREAAEVLTRSVPTDDSLAINDLQLTLVGREASFKDLFEWMKDTGKIRY